MATWLGSDFGSELAVQRQTKPFTSLGLHFFVCKVSMPHQADQERACTAPGREKALKM